MKKRIISAVILLLFSIATTNAVWGQSRDQAFDRRVWGYFFVGGGTSEGGTAFIHLGGGEGLLYKGFGVGGEIGSVIPTSNTSDALGLASVNLTGYFNRSGKVQPFVTGGALRCYFAKDQPVGELSVAECSGGQKPHEVVV